VAAVDYAPVAARLVALAEADPAREVCGFVTIAPDGEVEVVPARNVAGEREWASGAPGDVRRAYLADPAAHLALSRRLRRDGGRIAAVYHSHVDAPARLSEVDVEEALCDGAPILGGVDQIVIGTRSGKVTEIHVFRWRDGAFRAAARLPTG
jgi:proteasome lid subunit RPN8/RPN11